jgi:hypothetical protein
MCKSIQGFTNNVFCGFLPNLTLGCKMNWHYFGTRYGKGEWDGVGAVVKRALRAQQLHNP